MLEYPSRYFLASGIGSSSHELVSFDNALLSAGLSNYNLLKVSSILPADSKEQKRIDLPEGSALLVAYGTISSDIPGDRISSAIAVGVPEDDSSVGIIMEYSGHGDAATAESVVRDMVYESMQNHAIPCREIKSSSIEAVVAPNSFTTVISALAFW